jgi:hypothetical protein
LIIHQLITRHKIKKHETQKLVDHLIQFGFDNIPTLDIRSSLIAFIAVNNKKETVNDHVDIMKISSGLPISDIFLTDSQRKFEILELGLDKKYKTKVYSGINSDLEMLIFELNLILN